MEEVKEAEVSIATDPVMGNELSQEDAIKQDVGGGGQPGQFHKVLVEPEYSVLDPIKFPVNTLDIDAPRDKQDIHNQSTLRIGDKVENQTQLRELSDVSEVKIEDTGDDYSLIEECKALISESADRVLARSFSKEDKVNENTDADAGNKSADNDEFGVTEPAENNDDDNRGNEDLKGEKIDEINTEINQSEETLDKQTEEPEPDLELNPTSPSVKEAKGKKSKSKSQKNEQNNKEREIIESVQGDLKLQNSGKSKKVSKSHSIISMFKFSKRKPKEFVSKEITDGDIETKENKESHDTHHAVNNESDALQEHDDVDKGLPKLDDSVVEALKETVETLNNSKLQESSTSDESKNSSSSSENQGNTSLEIEYDNSADTNGLVSRVKRLNSLDSGIVVEKVNELQPDTTEYSVVQKKLDKKDKIEISTIASPTNSKVVDGTINSNKIAVNNKDIFINGDKTDEDFVYINERAIDVGGLDINMENKEENEKIQISGADSQELTVLNTEAEDTKLDIDTHVEMSNTSSSKVRKVDQINKPENTKLKKKSWSFQFGGNNKKVNGLGSQETVSMDPSTSQTEVKKSKWKFGKFSFRKSNSDVSASTPDINKSGIPEETETADIKDDKKKPTKLKKIKAKKEKKRKDSQTKEGEKLEKRSTSLLDLILGDANAPRSRRSIVEEDIEFKESDAFDGVSLSDLSIDGDDGHVSHNPKGSNSPTDKENQHILKTPTKHDMKNSNLETNNAVNDTDVEYAQVVKNIATTVENKTPTSSDRNTDSDKNVDAVESFGDEYAQIVKKKIVNKIDEEIKDNMESKPSHIIAEAEVDDAPKIVKLTENMVSNSDEKEAVMIKSDIEDSHEPDTDETLDDEKDESLSNDINNGCQIVNQDKPPANMAFSNLVYADDTFQATVNDILQTKKDNENQDDDSDAYVQLQQLSKDVHVDNSAAPTYSNISEVKEQAEIKTTNDNSESDNTVKSEQQTNENTKTKPSVIIMKEVGIQAPDIYMPLDIDRDFGYVKNSVPCFSVGVQVTDKEFETDTTVVTHEQQNAKDVVTMAAAYF